MQKFWNTDTQFQKLFTVLNKQNMAGKLKDSQALKSCCLRLYFENITT